MSRTNRHPVRVLPQIEITESPDFKCKHSSGVFGGLNPNNGRMIFFLDRLDPEMIKGQPGQMRTEKINRELQAEVHMSPFAFKTLMMWMQSNVNQYEKRYGEIRIGLPEKREDDEPELSHIS